MTTRESMLREMESASEPVLQEVLDYLRFLMAKPGDVHEIARASESVLAQDWLRPEEDEAWADL